MSLLASKSRLQNEKARLLSFQMQIPGLPHLGSSQGSDEHGCLISYICITEPFTQNWTRKDPSRSLFYEFYSEKFINIFCQSLLSLEHWADLRGDGKEIERRYKVTMDFFFL